MTALSKKELQLIDGGRDIRDKYIGKTEVLSRVKELSLLPYEETATTEMVAEYYNVPKSTIDALVFDNRDELVEDGYKVIKGSELKVLKGKLDRNDKLKFARQIALFSQLAFIRIGLLLTKSDKARFIKEKVLLDDLLSDYFKRTLLANNQSLVKENSLYESLHKTLNGIYHIDRHVKCGNYYIDFVIGENIAVECDEYGHINYDKEKEIEREKYIKNQSYKLLRYNPDKDDIFELINQILKLIQ